MARPKRWWIAAAFILPMACSGGGGGGGDGGDGDGTTPPVADAEGEMVRLVTAISAYAKARAAGFLVVPQNASALAFHPGYLSVVDGIGQEETYYGWDGEDGEPTPQSETERIEGDLDAFVGAGRFVLTLDYTFDDPHEPRFTQAAIQRSRDVYEKASARGYAPYVSVRELDAITLPPPEVTEGLPANPFGIDTFLYILNAPSEMSRADFLSALGETGLDLLVVDYEFSNDDSGPYTRDEIAALRAATGGGRIIAYLSIGEAEDYRWYWRREWDANRDGRPDSGAPAWLLPQNPDWAGNYAVAYWDPEWQAVLFGSPDSYLDRLLAAGFDGVYLDKVDAYLDFSE